MKWWRRTRIWLRHLFTRPARRLRVCDVAELPEKLNEGVLYVAGENGYRWFAAMVCPCGCGETIYLNLLSGQRPCWELSIHADDSVTISPSIWRTKGCQSHFFVRRGQIQWR